MSVLELKNVKRRYGAVTALDGVDLEVAAGSRTAIVGPSGCGKTTLLRLIAGFETPHEGIIAMDGRTLADGKLCVPAYRRGIGVVMQDGALFPHLTVAENIGFGLSRKDVHREKVIGELIQTVGLGSECLSRRPHQLSGGQQQRVALARAMAMKPRLMLLDEPFSALDTGLRATMRKAVERLLEAARITTILVTHDQAEALSFADQVAVMREGKFLQVGKPRDLYMKPASRMVAEFLGDAIVFSAPVADGFAQTPLGRIAVDMAETQENARIMLRPEQVILQPALQENDATTTSDELMGAVSGAASGVVSEVEFAGATSTIAVKLLNDPDRPGYEVPLVLKGPGIEARSVGDIVRVVVRGTAHVLQ
ncbi:MAG: ABC transporter ATP-binding protein [Hyphomicrobiales bacterium]|nr:ABC transporter ATP-binding protein [Hyphomicrobiales bacterium]